MLPVPLLLPAPVLYPFVRLIAHASYKKQSARPLFQVSFCYLNCTTVLFFLLTSFFILYYICMYFLSSRFILLLCFALHLPLLSPPFVTFQSKYPLERRRRAKKDEEGAQRFTWILVFMLCCCCWIVGRHYAFHNYFSCCCCCLWCIQTLKLSLPFPCLSTLFRFQRAVALHCLLTQPHLTSPHHIFVFAPPHPTIPHRIRSYLAELSPAPALSLSHSLALSCHCAQLPPQSN